MVEDLARLRNLQSAGWTGLQAHLGQGETSGHSLLDSTWSEESTHAYQSQREENTHIPAQCFPARYKGSPGQPGSHPGPFIVIRRRGRSRGLSPVIHTTSAPIGAWLLQEMGGGAAENPVGSSRPRESGKMSSWLESLSDRHVQDHVVLVHR